MASVANQAAASDGLAVIWRDIRFMAISFVMAAMIYVYCKCVAKHETTRANTDRRYANRHDPAYETLRLDEELGPTEYIEYESLRGVFPLKLDKETGGNKSATLSPTATLTENPSAEKTLAEILAEFDFSNVDSVSTAKTRHVHWGTGSKTADGSTRTIPPGSPVGNAAANATVIDRSQARNSLPIRFDVSHSTTTASDDPDQQLCSSALLQAAKSAKWRDTSPVDSCEAQKPSGAARKSVGHEYETFLPKRSNDNSNVTDVRVSKAGSDGSHTHVTRGGSAAEHKGVGTNISELDGQLRLGNKHQPKSILKSSNVKLIHPMQDANRLTPSPKTSPTRFANNFASDEDPGTDYEIIARAKQIARNNEIRNSVELSRKASEDAKVAKRFNKPKLRKKKRNILEHTYEIIDRKPKRLKRSKSPSLKHDSLKMSNSPKVSPKNTRKPAIKRSHKSDNVQKKIDLTKNDYKNVANQKDFAENIKFSSTDRNISKITAHNRTDFNTARVKNLKNNDEIIALENKSSEYILIGVRRMSHSADNIRSHTKLIHTKLQNSPKQARSQEIIAPRITTPLSVRLERLRSLHMRKPTNLATISGRYQYEEFNPLPGRLLRRRSSEYLLNTGVPNSPASSRVRHR